MKELYMSGMWGSIFWDDWHAIDEVFESGAFPGLTKFAMSITLREGDQLPQGGESVSRLQQRVFLER
jgi:hypothetical protein